LELGIGLGAEQNDSGLIINHSAMSKYRLDSYQAPMAYQRFHTATGAFVRTPVGFCPSGLLSYELLSGYRTQRSYQYGKSLWWVTKRTFCYRFIIHSCVL